MQRHEKRIIEGRVLGIEQIEAALDPLLHYAAGQWLMDGKSVSIWAEDPGALGPDVDGQSRHGVQEKGLDVVAGHHGDNVGLQLTQPGLHAPEGGVNSQHEVAVLGLGPRQQLRRVGQGEGADQHQPPATLTS